MSPAGSRAYYGSDSRAHELLAGALLALAVRLRPAFWKARPILIEAMALISGLFVLVAFVRLQDTSPIYYRGGAPFFAAMVAALIWAVEAEPAGLVAKVLSVSPVRWVGQISYGLYLWHWPVIVLTPNLASVTRVELLGGSPLIMNALRIGAAFTLATLSYYVVERPVRQGVVGRRLTNFRVGIAAPAGAAVALGFSLLATTLPAAAIAKTRTA